MFEISQIRCFVALAEELHFGHAAERLNMTQSPLSRQIQLLEHHVGTRLVDRGSRGVRLTPAGKAFFPDAARILRLANEAAVTALRVAKGERGTLAIGFTASFGYGKLPDLVRRLHERVPGIALTLKELVTTAQLEGLDSGQIDIGLMRPHIRHGELESVRLAPEPLMLAIPVRDAPHWPERPTLGCLHGKRFMMYAPYEASYFYQLLNNCFDAAGVVPDVVEHVGQIHTMMALVSAGVGVAVVPAAASRLLFSDVVLRAMDTEPAEPVQTVCAYRGDNDNPILATFKRDILPAFLRRQEA